MFLDATDWFNFNKVCINSRFFLQGMVAQCAGCNFYEPWAALVIGVFGGLVYIGVHYLMLR